MARPALEIKYLRTYGDPAVSAFLWLRIKKISISITDPHTRTYTHTHRRAEQILSSDGNQAVMLPRASEKRTHIHFLLSEQRTQTVCRTTMAQLCACVCNCSFATVTQIRPPIDFSMACAVMRSRCFRIKKQKNNEMMMMMRMENKMETVSIYSHENLS